MKPRARTLLAAVLAVSTSTLAHADDGACSPHRRFQPRAARQAVRTTGTLRREIAGHPTIRVTMEASCTDMVRFLASRTLDVDCAVGEYPGETFRGHVSAVRRVFLPRMPKGEDIFGILTVDVDNRSGKILPGRTVVASLDKWPHSFAVFGTAEAPPQSLSQ
jgi:hypothetical protein